MEEFKVDPATITPYFRGQKKHKNYWKTVDEYYHMDFHFNGYFIPATSATGINNIPLLEEPTPMLVENPYFSRLIDYRRPSESLQIKTYRRIIYLPESKSPCSKVYTSLRKIMKSPDWSISFKNSPNPPAIADDESLEKYTTKDYPEFGSVENWYFSYGMRKMLIDSNALIYVLPQKFDIKENEYYKPIATIIDAKNVYGFKENEFAIFDVDRDYEYKSGNGMRKGKCLGIITKKGYWEAQQNSSEQGYDLVPIGAYDSEHLPAWIIGGVVEKYNPDYTLYKSFMSPMLPGLDGLAMAISDEDAEWVQHVYSTMWYLSSQDCNHCQGKGKVMGKGKQLITCTECNGQGNAPKSPYRDMVIKAGTFDSDKVPTPPAGYIQKQTEIVKAFIDRIDSKEYRALSSVNHEFLAETPAVQSGIAKQYDREELQTYVYSVAAHSVELLKNVIYFINEFRAFNRVTNVEAREKLLPTIATPIRYDLITAALLEAQMKAASEAKADPEIIDAIEMDYVAKAFPNNPELRDRLKLKKTLDPFPRLTIDEKSTLSLDNSVDKVDIVVSNYLHPFIEMALFEYEDFCQKDLKEQKDIIYGYAEEKMKKLDAAQKIKDAAAKQAGTDPKTGLPYKQ